VMLKTKAFVGSTRAIRGIDCNALTCYIKFCICMSSGNLGGLSHRFDLGLPHRKRFSCKRCIPA
jgi:hypothetical protein